MIRSGGESKITLVGRRMFILSAAKAIVVLGIVGRLISLQITESKNIKLCLIKTVLESGSLHRQEV